MCVILVALFEVSGAAAMSEARRLDRHWRNARTAASHNPAIFRERAIGDYYLNDARPPVPAAAAPQGAGQPARQWRGP